MYIKQAQFTFCDLLPFISYKLQIFVVFGRIKYVIKPFFHFLSFIQWPVTVKHIKLILAT